MILQKLRSYIRDEMNELADTAATGGVSDWAAYQRLVGKIEGLAVAERMLLNLEAQARKAEGLDD